MGVGTFRPVKADRIEDHQMHTEHFFLPEAAARAVNNARRVIAVMLVSAFAGRELVMKAYLEAIRERYRFFSYGDCMLIL